MALTREDIQQDDGAVGWCVFEGAVQVVGAGLLAYSLTFPHYRLKKEEYALAVQPVMRPGSLGIDVSGWF